MHPNALSCPLGQVVQYVFTGTFGSMRGRGYVKELEPGRFLVRISITDPLTGKRGQPSKTIRGTKKDAELALARLRMGHLGGTAASTDPTPMLSSINSYRLRPEVAAYGDREAAIRR